MVGAGFAGLAAADELARAGAEVCVLEARDRVGGRVHSVPFAGAVVERGAEWVLPGHSTIRALAERFGLKLVLKGAKYGAREPRGGEPVADEELAEAVARIRGLGAGGGSIEQRLAELRLRPAVQAALRARVDVSAAHPANDLEAAGLAESGASFGDFDSHSVEGGNQRIAQALADSLGGAVRLSSPVRRVEWSETGARVSTDQGAVEADSLVLALPASAIGDVAFDPRQAGIAVGIAALGALVPAHAALGHGSAQAFVDGLHNALVVGAGLAALGALGTAALLRSRRSAESAPGTPDVALERA